MNTPLTFAYPAAFWAMAALPILAATYIHAERLRKIALSRLLAARLQPRLAGTVSLARRRLGFLLFLLGLAFCITALARPRWGVTMEEETGRGRDIIFAIDISHSMLAKDVPPNRLERSKFAALDLMGELSGDRVGLIAFAGEAFLQAPLTPDQDAVAETIRSLDTQSIGQGGSNLAGAIEAAKEAFGKGESTQRALIFFSDGEELEENVVEAAKKCKDLFRIYTIGVGTEAGAPVILPTDYGGEYAHDAQGKVVITKLDESRLREVANATGGFYLHLQNGPADMHHLAQMGLETMSDKVSESRTKEVPTERFQWPLVAGLVCLATAILLGERRRLQRVAVAAVLLLLASPADAAEGFRGQLNRMFDSETPAVEGGDLSKELQKVEDQKSRRPGVPEIDYNLGCTAYSSGDYDRAVSAFSSALGSAGQSLQAKATYNLANSLARRGVKRETEAKLSDWNNAVKQYDQTLALDPGNAKAKENRDAVLQAIAALKKQEEEKKQQQQQQQQDKNDQKKDDKNQDQKKQDQKSQDQQKQDGKSQQDQGQGQQNKEQQDQQKQAGQDSKDQQGKEGDPKDKKDGTGKDQQQQKPGEESKPGDPQPDENKDAQQQEKEAAKPKDGNLQPAGKPSDKKGGQAGPSGGEAGDDKGAEDAAEAQRAAKEGRMTEKDARALIEAAKKGEKIVPPLEQWLDRRRQRPTNGKDW